MEGGGGLGWGEWWGGNGDDCTWTTIKKKFSYSELILLYSERALISGPGAV